MTLVSALVAVLTLATKPAEAAPAWDYASTLELCDVSVTPLEAEVEVGGRHTVAATLSSSGAFAPGSGSLLFPWGENVIEGCLNGDLSALAGTPVEFFLPATNTHFSATLDANGQAFYSFSSNVPGEATVEASVNLPLACYRVPAVGDSENAPPVSAERCGYPAHQAGCEAQCSGAGTTLAAEALVNWIARPAGQKPVVKAGGSADPRLTLSRLRRCVKGAFSVNPSYFGAEFVSSSLFIEGRRVQKLTDPAASFRLNARRYKAGKHNFEVVTVFADGRAASRFGSFTRCAKKSRVTQRRVSPLFTG